MRNRANQLYSSYSDGRGGGGGGGSLVTAETVFMIILLITESPRPGRGPGPSSQQSCWKTPGMKFLVYK